MIIKINKEEHLRLQEWKETEFVFGSWLYGTNNENSDKDILVIYNPPVNWEVYTNYLYLRHCFHYDDKENSKQYVYTTPKQFMTLIYEGDNTIFSDILLLTDKFFLINMDLKTYKIIKCYLELVKRDLKEKSFKKIFHAERGLYIAECLLDNKQPLKKDIQEIYKNLSKREYLRLKENILRSRLSELFTKDEIKFYPEHKTEDDLLNKLLNTNNIKEFKYE